MTIRGYEFDFMAGEWLFACPVCKLKLYAPNQKAMQKAFSIHTHRICLGGW